MRGLRLAGGVGVEEEEEEGEEEEEVVEAEGALMG